MLKKFAIIGGAAAVLGAAAAVVLHKRTAYATIGDSEEFAAYENA